MRGLFVQWFQACRVAHNPQNIGCLKNQIDVGREIFSTTLHAHEQCAVVFAQTCIFKRFADNASIGTEGEVSELHV